VLSSLPQFEAGLHGFKIWCSISVDVDATVRGSVFSDFEARFTTNKLSRSPIALDHAVSQAIAKTLLKLLGTGVLRYSVAW
jgi:hypothetical protein